MIRTILIVASVVAIAVAGLVTLALLAEPSFTLQLRRFYFDIYRAIGIGFLVAVLAVVIPQLLPEARDQFERFKASRIAYSEAKTSVLYLPARMATSDFEAAVEALENAHGKLHIAETYQEELIRHLSSWYENPELWGEQQYWELTALKKLLYTNVEDWSRLKSSVRLEAARDAVSEVKSRYQQKNFRGLRKDDREGQIEAAIEHLTSTQIDDARNAGQG